MEQAREWISQRGLTGLLIECTLDDPGWEKCQREGRLPGYLHDRADSEAIERYVDWAGHWHFYKGLGPDDEGYDAATESWHMDLGDS